MSNMKNKLNIAKNVTRHVQSNKRHNTHSSVTTKSKPIINAQSKSVIITPAPIAVVPEQVVVVQPVVDVVQPVNDVVQPVNDVVQPVIDVVQPVIDVVQPVVDVVQPVIDVVQLVNDVVQPVVDVVQSPLAELIQNKKIKMMYSAYNHSNHSELKKLGAYTNRDDCCLFVDLCSNFDHLIYDSHLGEKYIYWTGEHDDDLEHLEKHGLHQNNNLYCEKTNTVLALGKHKIVPNVLTK